ncbi:citrate/2-methylcitrate synthase, partial [Staphylococcus epidermidis]|uniref:citrate/2-methylcitrate synthase n=1 Tax=Staphylococcus epidermidis TaxID=1282 RepID=UPI0028CBA87E
YHTHHLHPITPLPTSLSYLAHFHPQPQNQSHQNKYHTPIPIQAKIPSLLTTFPTLTHPKQPLKPNSQLTYPPNFLYILTAQLPTQLQVQPFNNPLILHADHQL